MVRQADHFYDQSFLRTKKSRQKHAGFLNFTLFQNVLLYIFISFQKDQKKVNCPQTVPFFKKSGHPQLKTDTPKTAQSPMNRGFAEKLLRRFELPTSSLPMKCSTPELQQHIKATTLYYGIRLLLSTTIYLRESRSS